MYSAVVSGNVVRVKYFGLTEVFHFTTAKEAEDRAAIANEAVSWIGTPFVNCADVKGKNGAVDCAMLLVRCYVDCGILPQFDPRPYDPQWYLHNDEPMFLNWITEKLGGVEVAKPRLGDVLVYWYGLCYSHGGIYLGCNMFVHANAKGRCVYVTALDDTSIIQMGKNMRPVKFFEVAR